MRRGSASVRTEQLRHALNTSNPVTKGNHTIKVACGLLEPEAQRCGPCPLNMVCYLQGKQISYHEANRKQTPCVVTDNLIRFCYQGTLCLVYHIAEHKISDCSMWGYSTTTSCAIGTYLEALWACDFLLGGHSQIAYLKKCFKRLCDGKKVIADNKFIKDITAEKNMFNDAKHGKDITWLHLI